MIYIFVFTLFCSGLFSLRAFSVIAGNPLTLPFSDTILDFTVAWYAYPSLLFQIWFWTDKLNIVG